VKASHTIRPVFDDPNLVSVAGLVPALRLAESAGMYEFLDALTVPSEAAQSANLRHVSAVARTYSRRK